MITSSYLIVANGLYQNEVVRKIKSRCHPCVIALDGAANTLIQHDIVPHVIIGDFDSVTQDTLNICRTCNKNLILCPSDDQDTTDLVKGLNWILNQQQKTKSQTIIHIACALTDARMDHFLSTLCRLRQYGLKNTKKLSRKIRIFMYTQMQKLEFVHNASRSFRANIGDKVGIIGFPHAIISTRGLKWNLHQQCMVLGEFDSTSNEMLLKKASVSVKGDALLMVPYY